MAPGQDHHRHGEAEPVGLQVLRLYFADEYAKRTVGLPSRRHVPDIAGALRAVQTILPKLEVKMIEFLAEWILFFLRFGRFALGSVLTFA